eukprot:GHVU01151579.1.p1 GENE.GHVU01151579.1~~GHVU01151579.1.p1  ORF type:complete len:105 (+),score=3.05 GHVU01151579.1:479-793(+)
MTLSSSLIHTTKMTRHFCFYKQYGCAYSNNTMDIINHHAADCPYKPYGSHRNLSFYSYHGGHGKRRYHSKPPADQQPPAKKTRPSTHDDDIHKLFLCCHEHTYY